MNKENFNAHDEHELIDVEAYTRDGKEIPHGKKYKIRVDGLEVILHHHEVTGDEILVAAGKIPTECYSLYIKLKHCDFDLIRPHEKVDLSEKKVEHFITKPPVVFHYTVDKEPETTEEETLTPNQILDLAGITPVKDYYLVRVNKDGSQISYKGKMDISIKMECPAVNYISVFNGETPVS